MRQRPPPLLPVTSPASRSYPALDARQGAGAQPLAALMAATNSLGEQLSEGQREDLMGELPKAMTKSSMLLQPLAREA